MRFFGKLIFLVVVLAALFFGYKTFFGGGMAGGPQMGAAPVSVSTVITKDVTQWAEFSGRLEAVDSAIIKPRVSGTIEKVHFKDGAMVKQGQLLFTIDPKPFAAELERARGAVAAAESGAANARLEYDRASILLKAQAISQREYDEREAAYKAAEGNVKSARGALQAAQVNMEYARVTAPISGKIGRAELTEGNTVNSGMQADTLTTIVSFTPIYASFEVDEGTFLNHIQSVPADKLSQIPVQIGLANQDDTPYAAHVHSFDNQLSASTGTIRVRAVVDNKDAALVPGLFARVKMGSADATHAVLINDKAIGTDQSKKFVYVIGEGNKAEYREIKLGGLTDGLRIITSGLKEGDKIVVNGLMRVMPGAPVTPEEVDMVTLKDAKDEAKPEEKAPAAGEPPAPPADEKKAEEAK